MQEQLTKKSPTLDRDAVYIKTVSILLRIVATYSIVDFTESQFIEIIP